VKIGILGGTFDPVHQGHLIVAEEAADILGLDQIFFLPARIPPHKIGRDISRQEHRTHMLQLALKSNQRFNQSDLELHREGPSYTVDTVTEFGEIFPDAELFFLMGHDSFNEIETWYQYEKLFQLCRLVVASRPGSPEMKMERFSQATRELLRKKILTIDDPLAIPEDVFDTEWRVCTIRIAGLRVSASGIRNRVKHGRTIRYLVPENVREYIEQSGLYRSDCVGGNK